MKTYVTILLCFMALTIIHPYPIYGGAETNAGNKLEYRLEYMVQGQTTGVILLIFRYRFFFHASASVLLGAQQIDERTMQFNFGGVDKTGYLLCTRGFSGKGVFISAADYNPLTDQEILDTGVMMFEKAAPDYYRVISYKKAFPFKILSQGEDTIEFKRDITGIHKDCSSDMQVESINCQPDFYFKIYSILLEMVKLYNHACLPGDVQTISELSPGMTWESPDLDFTRSLNRIGGQASQSVEEMVTFRQKAPFKLKYHVVSCTPEKVTISGEASPGVEIFSGYKIDNVSRLIELQSADGIVLLDKYRVEIWKNKGKGGFAEVSLSLDQSL